MKITAPFFADPARLIFAVLLSESLEQASCGRPINVSRYVTALGLPSKFFRGRIPSNVRYVTGKILHFETLSKAYYKLCLYSAN